MYRLTPLATCVVKPTPVLDILYDRLPRVVRCTNELGYMSYQKKEIAITYKYFDPNSWNSVQCIPFDIDHDYACTMFFDKDPKINVMMINPESLHGHCIIMLQKPVHYNPNSSIKPMRLLSNVENDLKLHYGADRNYNGTLVQSPWCKHWDVRVYHHGLWELVKLFSARSVNKYYQRPKSEGLGRNCNLFEDVRHFAYRAWRSHDTFYFFNECIHEKAYMLNNQFEYPLFDREVYHIAKSIAEWVWDRYSTHEFRIWCAEKGHIGGIQSGKVRTEHAMSLDEAKKRHAEAEQARRLQAGAVERSVYFSTRRSAKEQRKAQAIELRATGLTQKQIAEKLGVTQQTVSLYLSKS